MLTITVANAILPLVCRHITSHGLSEQTPDRASTSAVETCRFHLDLQKRNAYPNCNASRDLPTISIGSFRAASQRMHDAVMTEFGGSLVDEGVEDEVAGDDVVTPDRDMPAVTTDDGIELEGFP